MEKRQTDARAETRADVFASAADGRAVVVSAARLHSLRTIVQRSLETDEDVGEEVSRLAASIADAARAGGETPERLVIGVRALWRELELSQGERLHVTAVYNELVRRCIERYYAERDDNGGAGASSQVRD